MKFVLFIAAAFAAINAINCNIVSDDTKDLINSVGKHIRESNDLERVKNKTDEICTGYGSHFENATLEIQSCVALIDKNQETICSMVQNHFKRCLMPLTNMYEECLPQPTKELPEMMVDMIVAMFKRICKTDGEHILELGNPCIININQKTEKCANEVATKLEQFGRNQKYPSPQDVCELLESLRICLHSHLNSACGNQITRESFLSMYDEGLSVCKRRNRNEIEAI